MTWRQWLGVLGAGCASCMAAFAYRGDLGGAVVAAAAVAVVLALRACGEKLAATKAMMMEAARPVPCPAPHFEPVPVPRVVREPRPPWESATMPAVPARPVPGCERPEPARWQQEARVRMSGRHSSSVRVPDSGNRTFGADTSRGLRVSDLPECRIPAVRLPESGTSRIPELDGLTTLP